MSLADTFHMFSVFRVSTATKFYDIVSKRIESIYP